MHLITYLYIQKIFFTSFLCLHLKMQKQHVDISQLYDDSINRSQKNRAKPKK